MGSGRTHGNGASVVADSPFYMGHNVKGGSQIDCKLTWAAKIEVLDAVEKTIKIMKENKRKQTEALSKMPIEISYKQLCNQEFLEYSYELIKSNPGNMSPGSDNITLDGISKE